MKVPLLLFCLVATVTFPILAAEKPQKRPTSEAQIKRTLQRIVIPKLDFKETPLWKALDYLGAETRRYDSRGRGVSFVLEAESLLGPKAPSKSSEPAATAANDGDPLCSSADDRITVTLTNVPAGEALRYVTGLTNTKYLIQPDGIHIINVWDPGPMFTRDFRVPADFFPAFEREDRLAHTDYAAKMKRDFAAYLASNGLELPVSASATLNGEATRLTVHTTEDQFATIRKILDTDRPASAFPVPRPEIAKVIEGQPLEGVSDWRKAETDTARKLRTIRLPKVDLQNVNLAKAGYLLTKLSIQYDHAPKRTKRGVLIRAMGLTENPGWPPSISYSATNVSLLDAIHAIARLSSYECDVAIEERGVWWRPFHFPGERTYLVPPSTAAQLARWPEFINQDTPVPWMKDNGINLLSNGNTRYIAKRHFLIVNASAAQQLLIQRANEVAWREYYAAQKTKTPNAN